MLAKTLFPLEPFTVKRRNEKVNKLAPQDRAFHDWYRFVLSFPPHLVREYIQEFGLTGRHLLLDPFCGTGTTLVEAKHNGIPSAGIEANPFAHFATIVKTDWGIEPDVLLEHSQRIADEALAIFAKQGIHDQRPFTGDINALPLRQLPPEAHSLLLTNSISPLPLHKTLILLDCINQRREEPIYHHFLLALAKSLVFTISNLHFGPEVGVGKPKEDTAVVASWLREVEKMAEDLQQISGMNYPAATVHLADARRLHEVLPPESVDAVITSPPYPNEKDYTRTTRLESVILGFLNDKRDLRQVKKSLVRSNTRGVYKEDDDDLSIAQNRKIQQIAQAIEQRRVELGKTSGFEKLYGKVTRLYFGGMARHLAALRPILRPGAQLAYVVGDQASYLQVMIRTGELLAAIAQELGYELIRIDLFRTRLATATKEQLREEVVVLRWPRK